MKYPGQAEGRKVLISVLLTHDPTVPWSSSAALYHVVSYFWSEKWANSCLRSCCGALDRTTAHDQVRIGELKVCFPTFMKL